MANHFFNLGGGAFRLPGQGGGHRMEEHTRHCGSNIAFIHIIAEVGCSSDCGHCPVGSVTVAHRRESLGGCRSCSCARDSSSCD